MNIKHILVGLDVNETGERVAQGSLLALRHATELAKALGASVDLIHSTAGDRYREQAAETAWIVHEGVSDRARAEMMELGRPLAEAGLEVGFLLRQESPWQAVCLEAERKNADLIVLGKHNEAETGVRIGSVAKKVIHGAPCSVWVVKPDDEPIPKRILAAVDTSDVGAAVLDTTASLAKLDDCDIHVAHAWQLSMEAQMGQPEVAQGLRDTARAKIEARLVEAGLAERAELHFECSAPFPFVKSLAQSLDPDLVVMGTVTRTGLPGWLLGNTAERILASLPCSLLTVKP